MKTKKKHKLTDVLIGMEPTGHYWRKIAFFAKEKGYEVRFVRTTAQWCQLPDRELKKKG
jgi:transposase